MTKAGKRFLEPLIQYEPYEKRFFSPINSVKFILFYEKVNKKRYSVKIAASEEETTVKNNANISFENGAVVLIY